MRILVPESYSELSVGQFKQLNDAWTAGGDETDRALACIRITCNLSEEEVRSLSEETVMKVVGHLQWLLNPDEQQTHPIVPRFHMGNAEYGFIPDWSKLSLGEMIDLESYAKQGFYETLERSMSVMYRRVTRSVGDLYDIEAYLPSETKAAEMKDAPMDAAMGAMLFFSRIGRRLANDTINYLREEAAAQK